MVQVSTTTVHGLVPDYRQHIMGVASMWLGTRLITLHTRSVKSLHTEVVTRTHPYIVCLGLGLGLFIVERCSDVERCSNCSGQSLIFVIRLATGEREQQLAQTAWHLFICDSDLPSSGRGGSRDVGLRGRSRGVGRLWCLLLHGCSYCQC